MTSLAKQLQRLAVPHTQVVLGGDTRKTSLLFNPVDAAALDRETFFALGINGLEELESIDAGFEEFHRSLFSEASQTFERSVQTKEVNEKLDKTISSFLLRLSPYFLLRPAHKALEWLIYRYHIQLYNVDDLMLCILPYHETKIFVRTVQLINFDSRTASKWDWLSPLQKSGVHLARSTLVKHCRTNPAFLAFVCNMLPRFIEVYTDEEGVVHESPLRVVFSFYATTVLGILDSGPVTKQLVSSLFESLVQGLRSKIVDYKSASYILLAQVVAKSQLKSDLLEPLTNILCKYMAPSLQTEAVTCLLLVYQKQDIHMLRKKAFKYLSRQTSLATILYDLSQRYETNSLVFPIMKRLVPAAFKQAALNVVSSDSSDNDDDAPPPRLMWLLQELLTWLPLEETTAMFVASEVLEQYLSYFFSHDSEDNDSLVQIVRGVIKQLEGRYSDIVDTAVENVLKSCQEKEKKAAIMSFLNVSALSEQHQLIATNAKSLVLSLNHPQPSVRRSAVQFMMKNRDKLEDKTFLSNSVLARLQDDYLSVVSAVIQNCQNLWEIVEDKSELEDCLMKLLRRCDGKEKWRDVATTAVTVLCSKTNVLLPIIFSYLPLMSGSESELEVSRSILKHSKNPIIQRISNACLRHLPKTSQGVQMDSENVVSFNLYVSQMVAKCLLDSEENKIQHVVDQLCELQTAVGCTRELVLLEFLLLTAYHMIDKTSDKEQAVETCSVQARLLQVIHDKDFVLKTRSKTGLSLDEVESLMISHVQRNKPQIPSSCFLFFVEHVVLSTSVPRKLQKDVFWQYGGSDQVADVWLKVVVSMFGLVVTMAMNESSNCCPQARELIGVIMKHLFSDTRHLLRFLCLLWTRHANDRSGLFNLTPTLQVVALKLGLAAFDRFDQKEADRILQSAAPVLVSLLMVCTSVHCPVRAAGLECLSRLVRLTTTSAAFTPLVGRIVHCEQEILSDNSFVSQVIVSTLGSCCDASSDSESSARSPGRRRRKSKRQSSSSTMLGSFLDIALDDCTPAFVTRAVIGLTRDMNTIESFTQLLPLMMRYSEKLSTQQLTLPEADSLKMLLEKFTPDMTSCLQEDSIGFKMLLWAVRCSERLHQNSPSIQEIMIPLITPSFYDSLPSSNCRQQLLSCLFDVKIETNQVDVVAAVKKVIKHLTIDGSHVVSELKPVLQMMSPATVRETKRKRVSLHQEEVSEFDSASWQRVVVVLEAVQDKKRVDNTDVLIPICFQIMAR
ncbi:HEAT repeat-containing protein 1-like [Gigantopelta aegis]|uniref:HEAT repeat-containing protein 1-like n=1 Tax=Gigantopelta aegis TaxID=1735272 RepID=UPI001B88E69B|nr:HEAT repeat-containing protein 1-like [Gigantopelta aegis]